MRRRRRGRRGRRKRSQKGRNRRRRRRREGCDGTGVRVKDLMEGLWLIEAGTESWKEVSRSVGIDDSRAIRIARRAVSVLKGRLIGLKGLDRVLEGLDKLWITTLSFDA